MHKCRLLSFSLYVDALWSMPRIEFDHGLISRDEFVRRHKALPGQIRDFMITRYPRLPIADILDEAGLQ